jgi:hypothetical protein
MTITAMYVPCEAIAERCLQEIDTNSDAGRANTIASWLRVEAFRLSMNLRLPAPWPSARTKKTGSRAVAISVDHVVKVPPGREPRPMSRLAQSASILN